MFGTASISTKILKPQILLGLSLCMVTLFSCNNRGDGPCDYHREEYVKAEVVDIEALGNNEFEVWLEFNKSILGKENQALSQLRNVKITPEFLDINRIKKGIIFTGYVTELKSGNCEPYYLSFETEFKKP